MNRITDIIMATQFSTFASCVCVYCAHMIENGSWLNDNWQFLVWLLLILATVLWLFPHLGTQPRAEP